MIERKTTGVSATENALLLNQLISALPYGIMIADLDGVVFYRNNIFNQWIPQIHIENRLWLVQMCPFINPEQYSMLSKQSVAQLLEQYHGQTIELEITVNGSKIFHRIRVSPLLDDKDRICGLIEITENITELKEVEKSLQHARRFETVGRLASGIAHDFNNILQVINGHSEMLLESQKEDVKLLKSLEIILNSGQKASALTRQLLLFSRRQAGEFKQINLGGMLGGMQKILVRMLGEDITMSFQCNDRGLLLEGDESQLEQIIMNLAINARDAMPEGGKISIIIEPFEVNSANLESNPYLCKGKYIHLQFSDSGCGIPQLIQEHIFEPFFTTKETGRGTGLGLATVYSIVKQHQGFIKVESQINNGTSFHIYFPQSELPVLSEAPCAASTPVSGCDRRVLILEDDDNVRDFARQALANYGYQVKCACNVTEAREMALGEPFDLFFIDIVLPDGDGVSFLESVTLDQASAAFVLSSGYTEDKPQIKNTLYKGYSFLHKPFTINALLQACAEALQQKN